MNDAGEMSDDALLDGRVRLLQPRRGHRAGSDAVLLAAAVQPRAGEAVMDVGAGVGAVGLMIAARSDGALLFVERQHALAEACRRNVELNGVAARARVIEADVLAPSRQRHASGLMAESADVIVTNPPFHAESSSRPSPDPSRAAAHHLADGDLSRWIETCAELLRPKGMLALIHRADGLPTSLSLLGGRFGGIVVKAIHPRADQPASRVVLTAVKNSRAPLSIAPSLVLHGADGRFTPEAEAIHRGEALLAMRRAP
jgi:tRNA1(Val) A37 N6-methylase TrmN6